MTAKRKARLIWGRVDEPGKRGRLEDELSELLENGYRVVGMSQDGDEEGSYASILVVPEPWAAR
jgi:hypothetical protein